MYIIIAGCRKVGSNLALELSKENHDVVVIDSDPQNLDSLGSGFNGVTIVGMPIDEDILRSAGIEQADALAAVTNDDNMNVMVSEMASKLFHVPTVITRLYDPEREVVMNRMGLTTISPTTLAVERIKGLILHNSRQETVYFNGTGVSFRSVKPAKRYIGKCIADIPEGRVFGILKNGRFSFPTPGMVIDAEDVLVYSDFTEIGG